MEKEYWAEVDGDIPAEAVSALAGGVTIGVRGNYGRARSEDYTARAVSAVKLSEPPDLPPRRRSVQTHGPHSWVSVTVTDGKFHQIRKMTAAIGFPTLRLVRARIGPLALGDMVPGEVRELDEEALGALAPPGGGPPTCPRPGGL